MLPVLHRYKLLARNEWRRTCSTRGHGLKLDDPGQGQRIGSPSGRGRFTRVVLS